LKIIHPIQSYTTVLESSICYILQIEAKFTIAQVYNFTTLIFGSTKEEMITNYPNQSVWSIRPNLG
jgi:hypothetical protein